jgi:hypothetical protein
VYFDELSIEVPCFSTDSKAHLFFEILHVSNTKSSSKPHELGYSMLDSSGFSFIKLYNDDGSLISDGLHSCPVYLKVPVEDYLDEQSEGFKHINNAHISVRVKNVSTCHFQDPLVSLAMQLLDSILRANDSQLFGLLYASKRDLIKLKDCNFAQLIQHVPVVFNSLFETLNRLNIAKAVDSLQEELILKFKMEIFELIFFILHGVTAAEGKSGRENRTLSTYIQWFFKETISTQKLVGIDLLNLWVQYLINYARENSPPPTSYSKKYADKFEKNKVNSGTNKIWTPVLDLSHHNSGSKSLKSSTISKRLSPRAMETAKPDSNVRISPLDIMDFSWFIFDLVIKGLATLADNKVDVSSVISDDMTGVIMKLLDKLCPILVGFTDKRPERAALNNLARKCNLNLALFLRDLLSFTNVENVSRLVERYNDRMHVDPDGDNYSKIILKLDFFELFLEYSGLVSEILPKTSQQDVPPVILWFIISVLNGIEHEPAGELCVRSIAILRNHLTRLDYDSVLNEYPAMKRCCISAYFSFVDGYLSNLAGLKQMSDVNLVMDIVLCIYYIMVHTKEEKLIRWLKYNNVSKRDALLEILLVTTTVCRSSYNKKNDLVSLITVYPRLFQKLILETFLEPYSQQYKEDTIQMVSQTKNPATNSGLVTEEEVVGKLETTQNQLAPDDLANKESFILLFDKCSYFIASVLLLRSKYDAGTFIPLLTDYIYPFIRDYAPFYLLSRVMKSRRDANIDLALQASKALYETADSWRLMLGALLFSTPIPIDAAYPTLQACLKELLHVYELNSSTENAGSTGDDEESGDQLSELGSEISDDTASSKTIVYVPEGYFNYATPEERHMFHGVTLRVLVGKLFEPVRDYKPDFYQCFFLMYFTVATSRQVLTEIHSVLQTIKKETEEKMDSEQMTEETMKQIEKQSHMKFFHLLNAVRTWISQYFAEMDNMFLASLVPFIYTTLPECVPAKTIQKTDVQKVLHRRLMYIDETAKIRQTNKTVKLEPSIIPPKFKLTVDILEWDALEIARQITLIDSTYFRNIKPAELVARKKTYDAADQATRMNTAYNITMLGEQWKKLGMWAVTLILKQYDINVRRDMIRKLFEVCKRLREIRNYNACYALSTAFNHSAVFPKRLKETWSSLSHIQQELEKNGYGREVLKQESEKYLFMISRDIVPCVPLIPELKGDLARAKEHSKYINNRVGLNGDRLINFDRMRNLTWIIDKVQRQQKASYQFTPIPLFTRYFTHLEEHVVLLNDQIANELSHQLEN